MPIFPAVVKKTAPQLPAQDFYKTNKSIEKDGF